MTKEQVYDDRISPLMAQIIEICKEHKIAMLATFSLCLDSGLNCTTAMLTDEFDPPESYLLALNTVRPPVRSPLMVTVNKADGTKEITAIL